MDDVLPFAKQQDVACLEYSVGATASNVWLVVPQAGTVTHRALDVGGAALEEQVNRLVRTIRSGESAVPLAQLNKLGDLLLPPEAASLPEGSRLVIIPDGPLHGLPFGLLQVADKPLLERHGITYAISRRVSRPGRQALQHGSDAGAQPVPRAPAVAAGTLGGPALRRGGDPRHRHTRRHQRNGSRRQGRHRAAGQGRRGRLRRPAVRHPRKPDGRAPGVLESGAHAGRCTRRTGRPVARHQGRGPRP